MQLAFGLSRAVPSDINTAWGARLIAPADLLYDRQDLQAASDTAKASLIEWLNGNPSGHGAIAKAREYLMTARLAQSEDIVTVYEDEWGVIKGSTNASHGYVYVAGWLK